MEGARPQDLQKHVEDLIVDLLKQVLRRAIQRRRLIHRLGGAILEDVVRPSRVARKDVTQRAIVDHRGPCPVPLDDLTGAIEVGSLALDLLETSGLS